MVLVGEPTQSLESAAFTFLLPAGCCYDPSERAGLAALTSEMMLRGAGPRDSRAWVSDLENLGVERGESVGVAQATFSGATLRDNLAAALVLFADLLRRPHLPADQLEAGRSTCLQELRAIDDEPSHKLMIELRRRRYPDPWGRSSHGDEAVAAGGDDRRRSRISRRSTIGRAARSWPSPATSIGSGCATTSSNCSAIGRRATLPSPSARNGQPSRQSHSVSNRTSRTSALRIPTIPYKHPDYFQAWAAVGVLSSGSSSRLFTEVREKRGLCYTVYASLHTQRDRASVLVLCRHDRRTGAGNARRDVRRARSGLARASSKASWIGSRRGSRAR